MSKQDRRIEKVYRELTAVERARLLVEDYREGREPDYALRTTMPGEQWDDVAAIIRQAGVLREQGCLVCDAVDFIRERPSTGSRDGVLPKDNRTPILLHVIATFDRKKEEPTR